LLKGARFTLAQELGTNILIIVTFNKYSKYVM